MRWVRLGVAGASFSVVAASALAGAFTATAAVATSGATTVTSDWGSGFCADVKVTTTSSAPVAWKVPVYVSNGSVTTLWNGRQTAASDHVDVTGETWNATVSSGSPTTFGYCATGRPAAATPSPTATASPSPTVTASPTPTVSASPTVTASPSPTVSASPTGSTSPSPGSGMALSYVTSSWSGGATVTVTVTNRTNAAISSWKVDVPWNVTVSSVWSGVSTSAAGHVVVANETWNGKLAAGASTTFGMSITGTVPAPTSCSATVNTGSVPCALGSGPAPTPTASSPAPTSSSPTPTTSSPAPTVAPLPADFRVAPYVDMAGWPVPDLSSFRAATGISTYSLAFITSAGSCTPAWGGIAALGMSATGDQITAMNNSIAKLQAAGGKVLVSFGGANGSELAQTCTDVAALTAAYRSVIDKYGVNRIDFDVEGGAQGDRTANVRRGKAIAALQAERAAAGKPLTVSFTLPVLPSGLTADGLNVLKDAQSGGAAVDLVNIMAMDYGGANSAMGQAAIDAATATAGQISFLYPGTTATQRLGRVGVTPMIGENDVPSEVFTLPDAQKVTAWSKTIGLGELAWWSVTRDTPCPNNGAYASPTCSGTTNPTWAYAKAFAG